MLDVSNLEPLAFLTSSGKITHVDDVNSLADRPTDISFIRLRCVLDGSKLDQRVDNAAPLSFHFCLRLPQSLYGVERSVPRGTIFRQVDHRHNVGCVKS